jgi:hypothetical protein
MRGFTIVFAALAINAMATGTFAAAKIRLAQTSTVTNCMMICNSQGSTCQSARFGPGAATTTAATTTGNTTAGAT